MIRVLFSEVTIFCGLLIVIFGNEVVTDVKDVAGGFVCVTGRMGIAENQEFDRMFLEEPFQEFKFVATQAVAVGNHNL